jgi:surfeit locus 1 family protein
VSGRYDFDREFLIRLRSLQGTPGVLVMTPMRVPGRTEAVLVNRGFVPTPDAEAPASTGFYREGNDTTLDAVALDFPSNHDGGPRISRGHESWHRLDRAAMEGRLSYPLAPFYLVATVDTGLTQDHTVRGRLLPIRVEPPPLDQGPHLSYAIQWFLIASCAWGFGILVASGRVTDRSDVVPPG